MDTSFKLELKRIFCVGPAGVLVTILIWTGAYMLGKMPIVPKMNINHLFKLILIGIFAIDTLYLFFGSLFALKPLDSGQKLITNGPFKYIRHPLYSAFIYSITGTLALWFESWTLLVSVLPLALFWTWLVQKEENYLVTIFGEEYSLYQMKTGQFLPSWKALKEASETER